MELITKRSSPRVSRLGSQVFTMTQRTIATSTAAAAVLFGVWTLSGCNGTIWANQTKERTGNLSFAFVNTTSADAGFTYATWDQWDHTPGAINIKQLTVPAQTSTAVDTLPCARNAAIGTQDMVTRVLQTEADVADTTFNPDLFDTVVRFAATNAGTGADSLPTAGTAQGVELLLGVDYSCEDEIVFTFVEDPDAPGGFRVDFEVILDVVQNE
jgi:hypothetical protein